MVGIIGPVTQTLLTRLSDPQAITKSWVSFIKEYPLKDFLWHRVYFNRELLFNTGTVGHAHLVGDSKTYNPHFMHAKIIPHLMPFIKPVYQWVMNKKNQTFPSGSETTPSASKIPPPPFSWFLLGLWSIAPSPDSNNWPLPHQLIFLS